MSTERIPNQLQFDFGKNFIPNPKREINRAKTFRNYAVQMTVINTIPLYILAKEDIFGPNSDSIALVAGLGLLGLLFNAVRSANKRIATINFGSK